MTEFTAHITDYKEFMFEVAELQYDDHQCAMAAQDYGYEGLAYEDYYADALSIWHRDGAVRAEQELCF